MEKQCQCAQCGANLVKCEEYDNEWSYECPDCGTMYLCYPLDIEEDKKDYPYYNGEECESGGYGFEGECPICGHSLIWSGDFMRSEVLGDTALTEEGELEREKLEKLLSALQTSVDDSVSNKDKVLNEINAIRNRIYDIEMDCIDPDEDSLVRSCTCPNCGAGVDIIEIKPSDKDKYPYYKENGKN